MPESTIPDAEQRAIAFHAQSCPAAENLWVEGINLLLRGLDPLSGQKTTSDEQSVLLALVIRAWNTLFCAHDLAVRGYYSQALNLLRTPIEDWMTYWYLRSFPEEHVRFMKFQNPSDKSTKAPEFKEMLKAIESKHKQPKDETVRDWIKRLHVFSHVSGSGVVMVISNRESGLHYHLGPTDDPEAFNLCASESATIITALLEAVDNLRRLMDMSVYEVWPSYKRRVIEWQKSLAEGDKLRFISCKSTNGRPAVRGSDPFCQSGDRSGHPGRDPFSNPSTHDIMNEIVAENLLLSVYPLSNPLTPRYPPEYRRA